MSRVCQVTGSDPSPEITFRTPKTELSAGFCLTTQPSLLVESEKRFVSLRISSKGMRIIDKCGIEAVLEDLRARGEKCEVEHARKDQNEFNGGYRSLLHY